MELLFCRPIGKRDVHKGKLHDGLHQALVSQELWDQVAGQLSASRIERRRPRNIASKRLLAGMLFSATGARYVPTHCSKQGRRYFYYVCAEPTSALGRLPAVTIESLVLGRLQQLLADPMALGTLFRDLSVPELRLLVAAGRHAAERLHDAGSKETRDLIHTVLARVQVMEDRLCLEVRTSALLSALLNKQMTPHREPLALECPLEVSGRGADVRLVLEKQPSAAPTPLLTAVARARSWAEQIAAGEITSLDQLARSTKLSRRYVQRILQCAALSPARVEALVNGGEPHLPFWKIATEIAADRRSRPS